MERRLRIAVVGDIDSGKSTLIGRLLYDTSSVPVEAKEELQRIACVKQEDLEFAFLLDSFEEERKEYFTLDTTQRLVRFGRKEFVFIDVPGHAQLIRNMLTGASCADAALLVVDIQKGIKDQTRRHGYLLKFLGIKQLVVCVNKIDAESYGQDTFFKAKDKISDFLKELDLKAESIIPISAKESDNLLHAPWRMPWYRGESLIEAVNNFTHQPDEGDLRFIVQDRYVSKDQTIVAGLVLSGTLKHNDIVGISSIGAMRRVKGIKVFNRRITQAHAGENVGLFLENDPGVGRGEILYKGSAPQRATKINAHIFCLDYFDKKDRVCIRCLTQYTQARITRIKAIRDTHSLTLRQDEESIAPSCAAEVSIALDQPLTLERFKETPSLGRFFISKEGVVCAAGIVDNLHCYYTRP